MSGVDMNSNENINKANSDPNKLMKISSIVGSDKINCCSDGSSVDSAAIWRPFTQEKTASKPLKAVRGEGLYIYTDDGRKYADMISSWWVNIHGHANPEIAEVIAKQAATLEQVIFTAFSHQPAMDLVRSLQNVLPQPLGRFFFSDNGSTSVEVALKMAYQFFRNKGDTEDVGKGGMVGNCTHISTCGKSCGGKRRKYLHLEGSYHGDTFGAMSVSGKNSMYHFNFSDFFFDTIAIEVPEFYEGIENIEDIESKEDSIISGLERLLESCAEEVCALIVEPILQGARGMVLYRPEFLEKLVLTVRKFGILVIFDEVFTGFYRTGRFFAMDHLKKAGEEWRAEVIPDILCISKGITGGFMPLALTVTTEEIYDAFLSDDFGRAFIHGHSYTGNPIGCSAACKSVEILLRKETLKSIGMIERFQRNVQLKSLESIPVQEKKRRSIGVMNAFDLPSESVARDVCGRLFAEGIFVRPLGKTLYLLPPYCINEEELEWVYGVLDRCLRGSLRK